MLSNPETKIPADSDIICYSQGGCDLQINGALGVAFNDLGSENKHKLPEICSFLWQQGVDAFLPTLVTTSLENYKASLAIIAEAMESDRYASCSAKILGVHLEGPFLNPDKRGAHPIEHLRSLNIPQIEQVLGDYGAIVKLMTLAPELDTEQKVIPFLRDRGIIVSLGHSCATALQARQAFAQGATAITHAFNAMPPLHHREPGLLGEALLNPHVWCGLIADGVHVHPQMVDMVYRVKSYSPNYSTEDTNNLSSLFLVSDALAPLGLPDGKYPWDRREIAVKAGTARLEDGTLSGTTVPLLDCAKNLVRWGICEPKRAIALATESPRRALQRSLGSKDDLVLAHSHSLAWYWQKNGDLAWYRC
ncbi:N-acetylglucosamine-6-phosphate deacetylase [Tumidithrix elongata RA019]|uniref:N-acetylglucosamine-6-phosphate deacetylase n=1 Tax=Tumidithrix elongata BACA0141 TaxID=2716417 RepID=A0AAW9Q1B0_9CYAN|nr:N-acetylglucosamine-6-phosphate deacetylase [Tumidithrix elongata RA019]